MFARQTNAVASKTCVLATLSAPRSITEKTFGMHFHDLPGSLTDPALTYGVVRSLDYDGQGSPIGWKYIETSNGVYNWSPSDNWVNYHHAAGKDIVWNFGITPDWAVSAGAVGGAGYGGKSNMPPDNSADWIDYITQVVTRYKDKIKFWEGWNEPNLPKYWTGTSARMAELQRLLYQTVKSIDPSATVLSPCYTSVFSGIAGVTSYLSASDGASGHGKDWFDVASYHAYANDDCRRITSLERMTREFRAALAAVGKDALPIWSSEFGFINPGYKTFDQTTQRQLMRLHVLTLLVLGWDRIIFYSWDNGTIGPDSGSQMWQELMSDLVGHEIVTGSVKVYAQTNFLVSVTMSNGRTMTESFAGMP